jgi:hypothetical protein
LWHRESKAWNIRRQGPLSPALFAAGLARGRAGGLAKEWHGARDGSKRLASLLKLASLWK